MLTRRTFLASSALTLLQQTALPPAPTTRPNIAQIDRARILAAATKALTQLPAPTPDLQSDQYLAFTLAVPALAAAVLIDPPNAPQYAAKAAAHLDAWFLNAQTRLAAEPALTAYEPLLDRAPLAEIAVALPFLQLDAILLADLKLWFQKYLVYLTTSRIALLARDTKDHHASSWLLQVSALATLTANDAILVEQRHRFKSSTLRAQIDYQGIFRNEVTGPNPFRYSLYNLDLLAGAAVLLTTRFESLWDYELQDGPGMRTVIARHVFYIADRGKWPYPADQSKFNELPGRRPALVFAGRAYAEAEYITLWRTLNPDPADPVILRTFPIRQPILWLTQPKPAII
jgi:hypothetical protein